MNIVRIRAYQVDLPLREGSYNWSGGKSGEIFDSTVFRVDTDEGVTGHGEVCPLGPAYLPAYAAGARAGIAELAPHLIGQDPTALLPLNGLMESRLKGHPYAKSTLDIACWDSPRRRRDGANTNPKAMPATSAVALDRMNARMTSSWEEGWGQTRFQVHGNKS
ncbi:MAG: hypothetical protein ACODAB_05415 [Gemmatimonadota bacterium]